MSSTKPKAIVLIGPPGSGKGTHCRAVGTLPGFEHLSMGEVFRLLDPSDEPTRLLLEKVEACTKEGNLVPDDDTLRVFAAHMESCLSDKAEGIWLLDGIPRTSVQAEALPQWIDVQKVLVFECDEEAIFRRIEARAAKEGRKDDRSLDIVRNRLNIYRHHLPGILGHFHEGQIHRVRTDRPVLQVLGDVISAIG